MKSFKPNVPEDLRGSTICITGFSGYVGSHLTKALIAAGIRPFLIGRPNTVLTAQRGSDVATRWADSAELADQFRDLQNPVVINIAGHFVSKHGPHDIRPLVSGNLEYPIQIFEALSLSGHSRIVNIGTSWEYSDTGLPIPANLYALLKSCNSQALACFARTAPLQAVNVKLNDTYGGRDTRTKLMPLLKSHWLSGTEARLRAPDQIINLLHIVDVVEGILTAALETQDSEANTVREAFLLGRETRSLGSLIEIIRDGIAPDLKVAFMTPNMPANGLRGIWSAAPSLGSWTPRISLKDGLKYYFRRNE